MQCGNCCKDSRIKKDEQIKPEFIRKYLINVNQINLGLFDWEVNEFIKVTGNLGIQMLDIKIANVVYDIKNKISIITHYTYNRHPKCAFLNEENTCSIYNKRPIICKMWPCPYGKFQPRHLRSSSKVCNAEISFDELHEELNMKEEFNCNTIDETVKNNLMRRYGENYYYRFIFDELNELMINFIEEKTQENIIKPAKNGYNPEFLIKKIKNSKKIQESIKHSHTKQDPLTIFEKFCWIKQ